MRILSRIAEFSPRRCFLLAIIPSFILLQGCDNNSSSDNADLTIDDPLVTSPAVEESDTPVAPPISIYSEGFSESFGSSAYADDFNNEILYLSSYSFDDSTGSASASLSDEAIMLRAQSDGTSYSHKYLQLPTAPNSVLVNAMFDSQTDLSDDSLAYASVGLYARIFNSNADFGLGGDNPQIGNVEMDYRVSINDAGDSVAFVCLNTYDESGFLPYVLGDDGVNCREMPNSTEVEKGEMFSFGYNLDANARMLTLVFNEGSIDIDLPDEMYKAFNPSAIVQAIQENGTGQAVVAIPSLQLDSTLYEVSKQQIKLDQIELDSRASSQPSSISTIDGQIQFTVESQADDYQEQSLSQLIPSDYLESVLTLSSLSTLNQGNVRVRLESVLYNDLPAEERDGRTGDVRASIQLIARSDGSRGAEICLVRSDDAQFDSQSGLLDDERHCRSLSMRVELDTPYRVAIALDRAAAKVVFRINGMVVTEEVTTLMDDAVQPAARVVAIAENGATAVALVDDLRTAPMALTESEVAAGLEVAPEFPLPEPEPVANSDITPVFDRNQNLAFVDDFAQTSNQFGFNEATDRGEAGLGAVEDGIELRASSFAENDQSGTYSELYVHGETQRLKAKVSLSSLSDLPADREARATIRLQGVLFRDNQDFELNNITGDIYSSIEVQFRGDGGRRISYYVSRRVEGSDDEQLYILEGENGGVFEQLIPELDTIYELGMQLDVENNSLIFSVNETVREFDLPWQAFPAARNDAIVQVQHQGTSGRAIGTLYSVETDSVAEDFSVSFPLTGPYRPAYEARFRSQSAQIVDGRLQLTTDSRVPDSRPARLIAHGTSNYVGASLTLSSASIVESDESGSGQVAARIGGLLYRGIAVEDTADSTGKVYAALALVLDSDGDIYAEYCAYQSTESDFSNSDELIGGNVDNCLRFDSSVSLDTAYPVHIQFDEQARTIVYEFADERVVYDIRGDMLPVEDGFQGPQARASGKSLAVVLVDDLAFSETPIPLSASPQRLIFNDMQ